MKPTSIRLNDEIYKKIKEDAEKEKRSITKQIEYIIQQYYEQYYEISIAPRPRLTARPAPCAGAEYDVVQREK